MRVQSQSASESSPPQNIMPDNLAYPSPNHYLPGPAAYYASAPPPHMHLVAPPRPEPTPQRKRPKYTRSKTGCLTCRQKKIKCDETKPNCMRCSHGQRECTWPEGVPARKKTTPRRDQQSSQSPVVDTRPSTAGSSSVSDISTPPTRNNTPPKRESAELNLPPLASRRQSDTHMGVPHSHSLETARRQQATPPSGSHGYPVPSNSNSQLLNSLSDSASHYAQSSYQNQYPPQYSQGHSIGLPRMPSHQDQSLRQLPGSSSHGQWGSPPLLQSVDPIQPFFPSVQDRNLIHHYCDNALSLIMALPSENPILAANLQLVLSRAPGSDAAIEALRKALLGTAAVHQSYLFSRNGLSPAADEAMRLATGYRSASQRLLAEACETIVGRQSDAALGASIAISLLDIFSGGHDWTLNMSLAKNLVNMRGGPAVLLARSPTPRPGTITGVSRARLILETIAIYEMFGCLATGQEPTLLSPNSHGWWLEAANDGDNQSHVEKVYGMSRIFIPLLAKVIAFLSRVLDGRSRITEVPDDGVLATEASTESEGKKLYHMLGNWTDPAGIPERVQMGNRIHKNAAQILILRDVLRLPPEDTVVQQHTDEILSLSLECGRNSLAVDLNWPMIIAGSQAFGNNRSRVLEVFETFRVQCCYEIETAEHIVLQVWKRLDGEHPRADWRSVVEDQGLNVLIL